MEREVPKRARPVSPSSETEYEKKKTAFMLLLLLFFFFFGLSGGFSPC